MTSYKIRGPRVGFHPVIRATSAAEALREAMERYPRHGAMYGGETTDEWRAESESTRESATVVVAVPSRGAVGEIVSYSH